MKSTLVKNNNTHNKLNTDVEGENKSTFKTTVKLTSAVLKKVLGVKINTRSVLHFRARASASCLCVMLSNKIYISFKRLSCCT